MNYLDPEVLRNYSASDHLIDGQPILIRAIRPEDKMLIQEGFQKLSPRSAYFRFFSTKNELSPNELAYLTEVDFILHVALAATPDDAREIIGVGRYNISQKTPKQSAEISFTVADQYQGRGLATLLLHHLAAIARQSGMSEFRATVHAENQKMLRVLINAGYPCEQKSKGDIIEVSLDIIGFTGS